MKARTLDPLSDLAGLAEQARSQATEAAARAGVVVEPLEEMAEIEAASALFAAIWGTGTDDAHIPPELGKALVHAGNYASAARTQGGDLVGAVVGFLGRDPSGETYLHSHILGVDPDRRGANIGYALKLDQRAWALERGLVTVTWTFDPLVRGNARFNLHKLGAYASAYYESFYGGEMRDGINANDETDRLLIEWRLADPRAVEAANGPLDEPNLSAPAALHADEDGEPALASVDGPIVLCGTPADIVARRRRDPAAAMRWRKAMRATLEAMLADGYSVSGFTRSGSYVLERNERASV